MQRFPRYCFLSTGVLASTVMALSFSQRLRPRNDALLALKDGDIRTLTDHLNRAGLAMQLRSTSQTISLPHQNQTEN